MLAISSSSSLVSAPLTASCTGTISTPFTVLPSLYSLGYDFWQGVAAYLQKSYPKLYNGGKPSKAHTDLLKSEAEITETLKSRMHLSTPQVEAEPYNHVLENLSRLMEEAEAMKKATKGMK